MTVDYKKTVFLPKTSFPMHPDASTEAKVQELWGHGMNVHGVYDDLKFQNKGKPKFVLHDGPPYANGNIHMGHALNKILKDIVSRSRAASGYDVDFVPQWDCHGLPIEWQVEKNLLAQGKTRASFTVNEFRAQCRGYALEWVARQKLEFKKLGVLADWENTVLSMDTQVEGDIVKEFHELLMADRVYRGYKPVLWSTVEQTALADAEVEHQEIKTSQCWVAFKVREGDRGWFEGDEAGLTIPVWTTTPWTLPANKAVAFNPNIAYRAYFIRATTNLTTPLGWVILAEDAMEASMAALGVTDYGNGVSIQANQLRDKKVLHPIFGNEVPLIPADFIEANVGTGFVHIAPEHGPEDFQAWNDNHLGEIQPTVDGEGTYLPHVPLFAGEKILNQTPKGEYIFEFTNAKVLQALRENHTLLHTVKALVSYPHSWRSKAPLIYRLTAQWFLKLDGVRERALNHLDDVSFIPPTGENRLRAAVASRPDWLLSRQRVWGTPMCLFVHKDTGEVLKNREVNEVIYSLISHEGGDAWWNRSADVWLEGLVPNPRDYVMVNDVLDVWFDSGSSHAFMNTGKADLYLEGSDQHRGWFGSSLLERVATRDEAPFKSVLTHGFVLDHKGEKMSKSKGNVVDPQDMASKYGTDVLRLWVASSDYTSDLKVGDDILKTVQDNYRKIRNTFRFMLGVLNDHNDGDATPYEQMPKLERYMLYKLTVLEDYVRDAYSDYRFKDVVQAISEFCASDLSAFYFDARKDTLYCERPDHVFFTSCRTVMRELFTRLCAWLMPIVPFLVEEAARTRWANEIASVWPFPGLKTSWYDPGLATEFMHIKHTLQVVSGALEVERRNKTFSNTMDTHAIVYVDESIIKAFDWVDVAAIFRTSQATILPNTNVPSKAFTLMEVPGVAVIIKAADGQKCARSRKFWTNVGANPKYPDLSARDADAVEFWLTQNPLTE